MEKYRFFLLVLAIPLIFLTACGEGEPNNLADDQLESAKIKKAMDLLISPDYGAIKMCVNGGPGCPEENVRQSSSSEEGASSDDDNFSTSGNASTPSGGGGKSSNSVSNTSSSSKPHELDNDCPVDIQPSLPNFTCSWNPATREAGDSSKLSLSTYTVPSNMNCAPNSKGAWRALFGCSEGVAPEDCVKRDTAYFPFDKNIATSGLYLDMKNNGKNLTEASKSWPKSGNFVVNGMLVCSGIGYSCRKSVPCSALNITPATPPDSSNVSLTCDWATLPEGTNNLAKGTNLTACELKAKDGGWLIPNSSVAGCKTAEIQYCGGSALGSCDASKVGTIVVKAVVTCKGGDYTLKTLTYNVRENPTVTGSCTWDTKNNTFGGGVTAKVSSAVPVISNNYGRCDVAPSFFVGSVKKTLVSAGLVVDAWNGSANQTMTGITLGVACGAQNINTITCPNITVKDPNAMCEYQASWCENIALNKIKTADVTSDPGVGQAGEDPGACFFATTVDKIGNVDESHFKVNGVAGSTIKKCGNTGWSQPTCAAALASVYKADNGYYIYVSKAAWTAQDLRLSNSYKPQLHPNCEAQK